MIRSARIAAHAIATGLHCAQLAAALVAVTLSGAAWADDVRQYRSSDRVDPAEVARILGAAQRAPKMRSLRILGPTDPVADAAGAIASAGVPIVGTKSDEPADTGPSALSLPVQFAFDSANILPQARTQLDALAAGIKLLPPSQVVVIEGHTDAVGAELYNLQLSSRRASAVKEYLIRMHGIEPARLATEGYGKFRPLNSNDGRAAENRRVQFRGG